MRVRLSQKYRGRVVQRFPTVNVTGTHPIQWSLLFPGASMRFPGGQGRIVPAGILSCLT